MAQQAAATEDAYLKRPKLIIFNYALTLTLLVALIMELMPSAVLFMIGFAIAITVNYPKLSDQKERVANYADNALSVISMILRQVSSLESLPVRKWSMPWQTL